MSEENKVTAVEKTIKVKDPRKVELGKREAKERKARQHLEEENSKMEKEMTDYMDFKYFVGFLTLVVAFGGLYFSYKRDKRDENKSMEEHDDKENKSLKKHVTTKKYFFYK